MDKYLREKEVVFFFALKREVKKTENEVEGSGVPLIWSYPKLSNDKISYEQSPNLWLKIRHSPQPSPLYHFS